MRYCKFCGQELVKRDGESHYNKRVYCNNSCKMFDMPISRRLIGSATKKEVFDRTKNWQSARSTIRKDAERVITRSERIYECAVCSYNKYVEICHIKSVSSFPNTATIDEINSLENLVYLCPNHHWEYDKGILKLQRDSETV